MLRIWTRNAVIPVLAMAIWFAGCSDQQGAEQLMGPQVAQFAKGGKKDEAEGPKKEKKEKATKVKGKKKDGSTGAWVLATGKLPEPKNITSEAVVDGSKDVILQNNGHFLFIPKGTVGEPTAFRIRAYKKEMEDGTVLVAVDLRASVTDPQTGEEIDVGPQGWGGKKVYLGLTYDWADEVTKANASKLTVLWVKTTSSTDVLDTTEEVEEVADVQVRTFGSIVVAGLEHFSDYAIGFPDAL
jgi:hypothetical protein